MIDVMCLMYGDFAGLAERCLGSIIKSLDVAHVKSIQIALNAVGQCTRHYVHNVVKQIPSEVRLGIYDSSFNRCKYPMMRKMLYDPQYTDRAPIVMWLDDDSALPLKFRWDQIELQFTKQVDILGDLYRYPIRGNQATAIMNQPWFNMKPIEPHTHKFRFATGGWWCAKTEVLKAWDYPFKALKHNGGDTMLGELARQQNLTLRQIYNINVMINANEIGQSSKAKRRGHSSSPVWTNYDPNKPEDLSHHDFEIVGVDPR